MSIAEKGLLLAEIGLTAAFLTGGADTPTVEPLSPQHTQILTQRSAAVPFNETQGFTRDFFERVRKSTFVIELKGRYDTGIGTAWLARVENESYYFVTAGHLVKPTSQISRVQLWRPGIDQERLQADEFESSDKGFNFASSSYDVGVVKIPIKSKSAQSFSPLNWQDNSFPDSDESVLVSGFPLALSSSRGQDLIPFGFPITSAGLEKNRRNNWTGLGTAYPGNSGSPVAANRNGEPVIIGVISASLIESDAKREVIKRSLSTSTLNLQELMERVDRL